MKPCLFTGRDTSNNFAGQPICKEVLDFAKWYRDKLNVQQKQKGTKLLDTRSCLIMFLQMKDKGHGWAEIQTKLADELLLKGLLTEEEYAPYR